MDVLTALRVGGHEYLLTSGNVSVGRNYHRSALISNIQQVLDSEEAGAGPVLRMMIANGIQTISRSKFTLEGEKLLISVFLALFKRCALLWKLLLKEGSVANKHCSQRLLLKLDYSQKLTSRIFNEANLDVKLSLGGSTGVNVFILDLCVSTLQILPGQFPPDVTQIATAMILFLQQFQHYLPINVTPINPGHYMGLLETLIITAQPNKIEIDALELIAATLLQSITHYGWQTGLNDAISNIFTSTYSLSGKLSLLSKALYAYKPGIPGIEGLLNEEEISMLVKQLKDISLSMPKIDLHYSAREILLITQGVTRIPANCSGLIEKGIDEVLQCLMDQNDEKINKIVANISWQIATETTEVNLTTTAIDASQDFISPQLEDQDGSLALADTILQLLSQLIHDRNLDDLTEREICTMETLVHTIFDLYLHSEIVLKHAIAKMFGDKYIRCLIDINKIVHTFFVLKKPDIDANIGYGLLLQDMARLSEYFCEKANVSGLVGILLVTVNSYQRYFVHEMFQSFLNDRLTTLFYCAHITKYLYSSFGILRAFDRLTTVLNSPAAYTRLLARLVICCLHPIMGDSQTKLLELTVEESELLLDFIRQPMQPGGIDSAKLLKAASVLFREFPTQTVSAHFFTELCESVVSLLCKNHDDCVMEGALCLLWTLTCYVPDAKHHMSKMDNLIGVLTSLQQSPCSIVSSPARSILLVMGYHSYEDPDECYLCAISNLQYALYTRCIELCDQIISKIKSVPCGQVNLIRGKAYAHIHQRQLWHILSNRMLDVAVPWKTGDFVDRCASNAKKAIGDLGFALDKGVLDEDGSYLLDMAMIDHVLIKKQLDDCHRCLLCRRRGVKLLKSHTIPKFIVQEMNNQNSKAFKELGIDIDGLDLVSNASGHFKLDSSKQFLRYTLLCARCEQRLSQNGENQFQDEFIPPIYSGSNEIQNVIYDSNAYSFCLGILFRSFVNNAFIHFTNADEVYSLFVACRQHLIQLPAKITEKNNIPNPPPVVGMREISLPDAYLIISPSTLHIPNSDVIYLNRCMTSGTSTWFLSTPLNREQKTRLCHATIVHMAVCNIIVPFTPAQTAPLDDSYRIHPEGGVYPVLPEIQRWNATPPGVFQAIVNSSVCSLRQYQQVLSGLKTTKGDSRKADTFIKNFEHICDSLMLERGPIDIASLESMSITPEEAELISLFLSKSNIQVELLPEDFSVVRSPPKLILREGYMLLYHIHDDDTNITYFFTANPSDILSGKLIVIMTVEEETDNYQRVEGVHVHIKKDSSVCVTGYLQEPTTETLKQSQYSRFSTVTERVIKAVNILLQRCGSPSTFILCASIQTRCQNRVALNHKCTLPCCWYCKNSCHICMDQANQGYAVIPGSEKFMFFLHCSEECKVMIENISQFSAKVLPVLLGHVHDDGPRNLILMQSEGCFSSILCEYTVAQVTVCISIETASVTFGKPFAVVQLRTSEQHVFFSAYLANDFSPTQPIYDFPPGFSFELLKDSDIISQVIKMSLQHSEISTISHLLMKATEIDVSLSQYFSITLSREKFFCQDELEPLKKKLSDEDLCTVWMIEQIIASNIELENKHQIQILKTCNTYLPLLPSTGTLKFLFWNYFQLTCLLWNQILTDKHTRNDSLVRKLAIGHAVRVATVVFEQSPLDTQIYIMKNFSLSSDILILCGRLAIAAIEGAMGYIEDETIQFIILVNKFIMAPVCTSMSISVATLNSLIPCDLESTAQHTQQNVSSVAHHLLLTTILKVLQTHGIDDINSLSALKSYVLSLLTSPFMLVAVVAKAVAHLLTYPEATKNNMELTDGEVDHITTILCRLSQDKLTRVYFSSIILQVLHLLCSQPVNKTQFMQRGVVAHLQTLMEVSSEAEAGVIANILWNIINVENSDVVIDTKGDGQSIADFDSDVLLDISLTINQGLQNVFNCLLKIMEEFNSRYLECKQVPYAQAYTICTVVQLLKELHQIMETNEILELIKSIATFVKLFGSSITKYRKLWQSIPNGVLAINAIEILMLTWAGIRETSQLLIGTGCLKLALNIAEELTSNDIQSLQNQVGVVYKCARLFPMQVTFQLEYSDFQPLLNCSLILVRILTKCIFASVAKYREYPNILQCITLQKEEIAFISSRLTDSLAFQRVTNVLPFSNPGEILHSLKILTSYPCDKRECVLPILLDILTTTSLCDDKTVAKLALEILWNLSFDPSVALAIINHENVIFSLQKLVLNSSFSSLSTSILWTLGHRKVQSIVCCWDYVLACYHSGKYDEVVTWCDHLLGTIEASNPLVTSVKNCKGKSLAQKYLCKQVQHLFRSGDWASLGYDNNAGTFKSITERMLSDLQLFSNELLKRLSLKDLHNWEDLLSQGLQAINLLGEVLDSNELDEEGSELLDLLLIDYSKGAGELNKCKRCLLCRVAGDLTPIRLQPQQLSNDASVPEYNSSASMCDQNTFIFQSYMYVAGSQITFMFCSECQSLLSYYCYSGHQFFAQASGPIKDKPFKYDKSLYTCLVAHIAQNMPLTLSICASNWKAIYAAFVTCRQILLSPNKGSVSIPKLYFLINPFCLYTFNKHSMDMLQLLPESRNICALVANQQRVLDGADTHECTSFLFHTGAWNIVLFLGSDSKLPPEYLINPNGGIYPTPSLKQRWEMLPFSVLKTFHDLIQADEHRGAFQSLLSSEGLVLSRPSGTSLPLFSYSARFLLPCRHIISFLPKQFCIQLDSENNIKSISVPEGHTVLGHYFDRDDDFTLILACVSDVKSQKKQFYYIYVCSLQGYIIVEAGFLKGRISLVPPITNPALFPMIPSLGIQEVHMIRQHIAKKLPISLIKSLPVILMNYEQLDFIAVSNYVDVTRDINVTVSVDTKCSSEGCWYCKHRCHNCFQESSMGYNYKTADGQQLYHCSERCYHMHTGDIADSTIFDLVVGKDDFQLHSANGTHLLLSSTVNLHTTHSKNTVMSTQLCVTHNHKNIPSGVMYVCAIFCNTEIHNKLLSFFVDHTLSPVKSVWPGLSQDLVEIWREKALIKRALQPALDNLKCDSISTFLKTNFPCLISKFMDINGKIYSLLPNGEKVYVPSDVQEHSISPQDCIRNIQ